MSCEPPSRRWWDAHAAELHSDAAPIHHYRLAAELDRVVGDDVVVIGDGGDVVAALARVLACGGPDTGSTRGRSAVSASVFPTRSASRPHAPRRGSSSSPATGRSA